MTKSVYSFVLTLLSTFAVSNCTTTSSKSTSPKNNPVEPYGQPLSLDSSDQEALFDALKRIDSLNGRSTGSNSFYTLEGKVVCQRDGALKSCNIVRSFEAAPYLSQGMPAKRPEMDQIEAYVTQQRPELQEQRVVMLDVQCDYAGKQVPPYNQETIRCVVGAPHEPGEAVLAGKLGVQLANSLNQDVSKSIVVGSVDCTESDNGPLCLALPQEDKNDSEGMAARTAVSINQDVDQYVKQLKKAYGERQRLDFRFRGKKPEKRDKYQAGVVCHRIDSYHSSICRLTVH